MDPEHEQSDLGPHCLPKKHFSRREKQTTVVAIGALRVNSMQEKDFFLTTLIKFIIKCIKITLIKLAFVSF